MAVAFVDMLGFAMIFPLLPYYAQDFGTSEVGIGIIMASFSAAQPFFLLGHPGKATGVH